MKHFTKSLTFFLLLTAFHLNAQEIKEQSWEEISKGYTVPDWFKDAKFGVFTHWGPQTQPDSGGGWYARHMYMRDIGREAWGRNAYPYHVKTYGHPSEKGFKDVIHAWKAENLDTDALVAFFKEIGAKYYVAMANHHDHFDNFASTHHPWNSVNVGPKRDIIGEFVKSAKKYDLPVGASVHDDRFMRWWLPAFGADQAGPKKGVPYDGHMTLEDGRGKWWEGLDPALLYGLPPKKRTPGWETWVKENWVARHTELVDKYNLDMLWFDGYDFPYGEYGKQVCAHLFSKSLQENGKIEAVITNKANDPGIVYDVERGVANEIKDKTWQGTITFTSWFYKKDNPRRHNERTILEVLVDAVSKNGNLLVSVELYPDGMIVKDQKEIMEKVGNWLKVNGEAIYATRPWEVYGDGSSIQGKKPFEDRVFSEVSEEGQEIAKKGEQMNERTIHAEPYESNEVRFTTKGDILYMIALNPKPGELIVPSLGIGAQTSPGKIKSIYMISTSQKIKFKQKKDFLELIIPGEVPGKYPVAFRINGAL